MSYDKSVTITKDGQTATIMASSLRVWERHGWTAEDDGSSEKSHDEQPAKKAAAKAPAAKKTTRKAE